VGVRFSRPLGGDQLITGLTLLTGRSACSEEAPGSRKGKHFASTTGPRPQADTRGLAAVRGGSAVLQASRSMEGANQEDCDLCAALEASKDSFRQASVFSTEDLQWMASALSQLPSEDLAASLTMVSDTASLTEVDLEELGDGALTKLALFIHQQHGHDMPVSLLSSSRSASPLRARSALDEEGQKEDGEAAAEEGMPEAGFGLGDPLVQELGRLELRDWVAEQQRQTRHPSELEVWLQQWDIVDSTACSKAAAEGDLGQLQSARAEGCPWDEWTCSAAAGGGHLEVLQWARAEGCPEVQAHQHRVL